MCFRSFRSYRLFCDKIYLLSLSILQDFSKYVSLVSWFIDGIFAALICLFDCRLTCIHCVLYFMKEAFINVDSTAWVSFTSLDVCHTKLNGFVKFCGENLL